MSLFWSHDVSFITLLFHSVFAGRHAYNRAAFGTTDDSIMFTGIVEEAGNVVVVKPSKGSLRMVVEASVCGRGVKAGDSVAVNGCCLTVVRLATLGKRRHLHFDLLQETWDRTNFRELEPGRRVNLERSLPVGGRLGGHFVTGHIDGCGTIRTLRAKGGDRLLDIAAPAGVMRYVILKGSIAVDGMSLTVAAVKRGGFQIWIIPHTWEVTSLSERRVGDAVNLEADLLGKYVEKFMSG